MLFQDIHPVFICNYCKRYIPFYVVCGYKNINMFFHVNSEQLAADKELADIDAIAMELRNIREQRQQVYKVASNALNKGTISENIVQTTNALQVT